MSGHPAFNPPRERRMTRAERDFAVYLAGERAAGRILFFAFEPLKLQLADRTWYTPDFLVVASVERPQLVEVKALWRSGRPGWREDARVKWKVAAETYPCFQFAAVWREGGKWRWERYGEKGRS